MIFQASPSPSILVKVSSKVHRFPTQPQYSPPQGEEPSVPLRSAAFAVGSPIGLAWAVGILVMVAIGVPSDNIVFSVGRCRDESLSADGLVGTVDAAALLENARRPRCNIVSAGQVNSVAAIIADLVISCQWGRVWEEWPDCEELT